MLSLTQLTVLARTALVCTLITVSYLAFSNQSSSGIISYSDKLNHLLAFLTLAGMLDYALPASKFGFLKIVLLLLFGLFIEATQYMLPYRDCSWLDFSADVAGVVAYWLLAPVFIKLPLLRIRQTHFKPSPA